MKNDSNFWGNTNESPSNFANELAKDENSSTLISANDLRAKLGAAGSGLTAEENKLGATGITLENKSLQAAYYHDQLPPFDVKLIAATERGHGAIMEILGMEILNCGSGISVDDITTDESCTWIGVNIIPWHSQTYNNPADTTTKLGTSFVVGGAGSVL